jgi:hypothetical protein
MKTPTSIQILTEAAEFGLKLGTKLPDTLTVEPGRLCSPEFATALKTHKSALLALLRLPFVMAFSKTLNGTVFFCEDEATRAALVQAGSERSSIYTRTELQILVAHNRARPFLPDELIRLHQAKHAFNARMTP